MKHLLRNTLIAAALPLLSLGAWAQAAVEQPAAAVSETAAAESADKAAVKAEGIWIDVRTAEEFAPGHLEDAVNIPVDQIAQAIEALSPDKDAPLHVYCRVGRRAEMARQLLLEKGYTNVTNHGGYEELVEKGLR